VHSHGDAFAEPKLAAKIADALRSGQDDVWLPKLPDALNGGLGLQAESWTGLR